MFKQILLLSLLGLALAFPNSKVEPRLVNSLRSNGAANILVKFGQGNSDIIESVNSIQFNSRGEKGTHLVAALKSRAETSQKNAASICQLSSVHFKQFWVNNELYVKGASQQLINELEALSEVTEIREERTTKMDWSVTRAGEIRPQAIWNLEIIEATDAWGLPGGNNGQGVVVANIDTGVQANHEALRGNYRADHGWFDAVEGREEPYDIIGHGTHCMGSTAGAAIGVAPGAQWIACMACSVTACSQSEFIACGQWVLCPTLANGTNPDCSKAPNVVSNSWGFFDPEEEYYDDIISAWKAVDIIPVFASGNEGPGCSEVRNPGNKDVITVGATDEADALASWSSPGPVANNVTKPDISAPGAGIYSSIPGNGTDYGFNSGTSMATPHVAGAVALLLSSNPNLNYTQVRDLLTQNVDTRSLPDVGRLCGALNSTVFPNNHYGHGRLNARKALEATINV